MGLCEVIFVVLLIAKLLGASVSWLVVFTPLIISVAIYIVIGIVWLFGMNKVAKEFKKW